MALHIVVLVLSRMTGVIRMHATDKIVHSNHVSSRHGYGHIRIVHISSCIKLDLETGYLYVGSEAFRPNFIGVTQGSSLSMGLSDLVGCYLEHDFRMLFFHRTHVRWVRNFPVLDVANAGTS